MVREIREGHAYRPVRRGAGDAVKEDDAVFFRQSEDWIERVNVGLYPVDDILPEILSHPELEVDEAVVIVVMGIVRDLDPEPLYGCFKTFLDDANAGPLIILLAVHELVQREDGHHYLLRERKACGMIEGDVAAVRDNAVDECQLLGFQSQGVVAVVNLRLNLGWVRRDQPIQYIVLVQGDGA